MKTACAECISVAIEAHREDLLRKLLLQKQLEYRDTFWAPKPHVYLRNNSPNSLNELIPELHCIRADTNLELIGHENCGHVAIDTELLTPPTETSAYVMVSLTYLAILHTTEEFYPFSILLSSGIEAFNGLAALACHWFSDDNPILWNQTDGPFDAFGYLEPSRQIAGADENMLPGPLELNVEQGFLIIEESFSPILEAFHLRTLKDHELLVYSVDSATHKSHYSWVSAWVSATANYNEFVLLRIVRVVGRLGRELKYEEGISLEHLTCLSDEDINVNNFFEKTTLAFCHNCKETTYSQDGFLSYFARSANLLDDVSAEEKTLNATKLNEVLKRFLRCGFSYFVSCPVPAFDGRYTSLFYVLYLDYYPDNVEIIDGMSHQLLALGFGRPELHVGPHETFDARLAHTRQRAQMLSSEGDTERAAKLRLLVERFESGPLTLTQLSRIAIRRAIGGSLFEKRVKELDGKLPPLLCRYVSDPTELMF